MYEVGEFTGVRDGLTFQIIILFSQIYSPAVVESVTFSHVASKATSPSPEF